MLDGLFFWAQHCLFSPHGGTISFFPPLVLLHFGTVHPDLVIPDEALVG